MREMQMRQQLKRHTENWQRSTIRTAMKAIPGPQKNLRKSMRLTEFSGMRKKENSMISWDGRHLMRKRHGRQNALMETAAPLEMVIPANGIMAFTAAAQEAEEGLILRQPGTMDDILKNLFGAGADFGENYSDFFGRRTDTYNSRGFSGEDLHGEIEVTFDEAAFGGRKVVRFQDSSGKLQSLEIQIPAGISSGKTIRLKEKGMASVHGGKAGDLLLKVTVKEKTGFRREGLDVYSTISIPFSTAVLGGEVQIPTIYGNVLCKIAPGTQSGSKIRLKGKGIVSMGNPSVHGDQYAAVEIQVPRNLSAQSKEKLREFEKSCRKAAGNVA